MDILEKKNEIVMINKAIFYVYRKVFQTKLYNKLVLLFISLRVSKFNKPLKIITLKYEVKFILNEDSIRSS